MTKYEHYKLTKLEKPLLPSHKQIKKKENDQNNKKNTI